MPKSGLYPTKIGAKVQHEIYHFRNTTGPLIPKEPFERLVREIAQDYMDNVRMTPGAIQVMRVVAEDFLVRVFENTWKLTLHAKRVTLLPHDMKLYLQLILEYEPLTHSPDDKYFGGPIIT
ncbi:Histone H3.3-like type 1 [Leucoagaricus sp. SymC.cos]|nr:Histone H3.3-like type 1 [Leucoagaricus sp. SymC.cos]